MKRQQRNACRLQQLVIYVRMRKAQHLPGRALVYQGQSVCPRTCRTRRARLGGWRSPNKTPQRVGDAKATRWRGSRRHLLPAHPRSEDPFRCLQSYGSNGRAPVGMVRTRS